MAILHNPIANLDADGRLVRLHCGTPGENCQLDDAKDKETLTWVEALLLLGGLSSGRTIGQAKAIGTSYHPRLCHFCFGGEGDD